MHLVDADLYSGDLPVRVWHRAGILSQGPGAFLVASSAVRQYGVAGLPAALEAVEVALLGGPSRLRRTTEADPFEPSVEGPEIVVRQLVVPASQLRRVDGLLVRAAAESIVDTALNSDRATALSLLDSGLNLGVVGSDELRRAVYAAYGRRGVVALRELFQHADGHAESPLESRVRLACIDGHVAPDELQHPVRDRHGNLVALGDMAWLKRRSRPLIGEADGATVHSQPTAVFRDRWRGNALAAQGCDVIRFTWADAMRPPRVVAAVKAALRAA